MHKHILFEARCVQYDLLLRFICDVVEGIRLLISFSIHVLYTDGYTY